jgi:hypothetical protein
MKRLGYRTALGAGAAALVGAACALVPLTASADAQNPKSAAECRALKDFNERGACWDALDKKTQTDTSAARKHLFGLGKDPEVAKEEKEAKALAKQERKNRANDGVDSLELTLADVENTPRGLLRLTSTEGAVWEQTDGDEVGEGPRPGDTVTIKKGFLGGYLCQVTRWQEVRCQRDK